MTTPLADDELLTRLVRFDSTSHKSNIPIADFLCDYLDLPKTRIIRNPDQGQNNVNLLVRIGPESERGAGLILSGHLDVVPALEPNWNSDPFDVHADDECYYGRGVCDMKGFVALATNLARPYARKKLTHPIVLLFTFDEEVGTIGARHFVDTWGGIIPLPHHAIIGEPTRLGVVRMHKGHVKIRVTTRGRAAHSGYPHLGVNAIEPMATIVSALTGLNREFAGETHDSSRFYLNAPSCTINLAMIHGGSAINIVPDACTLDVGVRILPGVDPDEIVDRVRRVVDKAGVDTAGPVEKIGVSPPLLTDADSRIHREACSVVGQTDTLAVSYASDAGVFSDLGINSVLFGPGDIAVAHKPNECLLKREFVEASGLLEQMIRRFCVE